MSLKSKVLAELERSAGRDVSGQTIADKLNVSRSAVSKAVEALKSAGYKITSRTNRGYCLDGGTLSASVISDRLPEQYRYLKVFALRETDSTNNEAKRLLADGIDTDSLIVADSQTSGRGRRGRSFYSPPGSGLYMTLILCKDIALTDGLMLTTLTAVAVARVIRRLTGKLPAIKWVNDIYLGGKKICGILTEAVTNIESGRIGSVIIGIGINVNTEEFPDELRSTAGSLGTDSLTRGELAAAIAGEVLTMADDISNRSYLDEYRELSMVIGKNITFNRNNTVQRAEAVGIDNSGGLIVRLENGSEETLISGEITIRLTENSEDS